MSGMDDELARRTVFVTGAGRNIGRAIALEFAGHGARVAIGVRSNEDEARAVAEEVSAAGGTAFVAIGDMGDAAARERLIASTTEALGPVDVLVCCAALRPRQKFLDISLEDWDRVLSANLTSVFHFASLVLPGMVASGFGRIITIGGPDGQTGAIARAHNVTAKAGLIGLTKAMAMEFGRDGITANVVSPGSMDTTRNMADYPWWPPSPETIAKMIPVNRLGQPDEIANACAFLASERSGYISGQVVHVNGGSFMP